MNAIALRASRAPLAFLCGGSVRPGALAIDEHHDAAPVGTAAHEVLRGLPERGAIAWDDVAAIAMSFGADPDEVRMLAAMGVTLWPDLAPTFAGAATEVAFSAQIGGARLTGHVDMVAVDGPVARVADWKTGRRDNDYGHQMRAYGALVLADDPRLTECIVTVVWVRDGEVEHYRMTREAALAWERDLRAAVVEWDGTYRPGAHCPHCPRSHECAAANALARRDVAALLDADVGEAIEAMAPDALLSLYRKATTVARMAERVHEATRARVEKSGDVVATDGRLTLATEERRHVDTARAWPVLESALTDEELAAAIDVRLSRVEKAVAEKAGRGNGAKAVRALGEALAAAGAVETRTIRKLVERRG